jgi:copper(I)-binding protein
MRITQFAVLACAALAACHHSQVPAPAPVPAAQSGIVITSGRLVLPAVSGHPGAAYFTLANQGQAAATVSSISIAGADKSELDETTSTSMQPLPTLTIPAGSSVILAPGGKHVMVFALQPGLAPGGTADMTIGFSDGSKLAVPLSIQSPGGMYDMSGMQM